VLRAVFFDFNGILVDDEALHHELFEKVLGEEGLTLSESDYYETYVGFDDSAAFTEAFSSVGRELDSTLLVRLIARKSTYYQERIRSSGFPFFAGSIDLVKAVAGDSLALAVVSGALRHEIEDALRQEDLRDLFKIVVAAEDVDSGKPDPEGYTKALQDLNSTHPLADRLYHPHEVLAVEDTPAGLEAASSAGLVTLGVGHTFSRIELSRADIFIEALDGLTLEELHDELAEVSRS